MKLIIDISEEDRKDIGNIHFIREDLKFKIGKAIMNGTPLDDVKTEIGQFREALAEKAPSLNDLINAQRTVDVCLGIIDKYIGGVKNDKR